MTSSSTDHQSELALYAGDGHIRQASCLALASRCREPCSSSVSLSRPGDLTHLFHATSEYSLSSAIQSLYLIRDEQTGHAFVVSGSDDGGVAIWSLSWVLGVPQKSGFALMSLIQKLGAVCAIHTFYRPPVPCGTRACTGRERGFTTWLCFVHLWRRNDHRGRTRWVSVVSTSCHHGRQPIFSSC